MDNATSTDSILELCASYALAPIALRLSLSILAARVRESIQLCEHSKYAIVLMTDYFSIYLLVRSIRIYSTIHHFAHKEAAFHGS